MPSRPVPSIILSILAYYNSKWNFSFEQKPGVIPDLFFFKQQNLSTSPVGLIFTAHTVSSLFSPPPLLALRFHTIVFLNYSSRPVVGPAASTLSLSPSLLSTVRMILWKASQIMYLLRPKPPNGSHPIQRKGVSLKSDLQDQTLPEGSLL